MLENEAFGDARTGAFGAPAFRERMPTLPPTIFSEYARIQTGPSSWSAHRDVEALSAWALEAHDDPLCAATTDLLVDISPTDVPHVAMVAEQVARFVSHREAFVVASIDGESTLEMMLDAVDLPAGEVLAIICNLCACGIVVLDRSQRTDRR